MRYALAFFIYTLRCYMYLFIYFIKKELQVEKILKIINYKKALKDT